MKVFVKSLTGIIITIEYESSNELISSIKHKIDLKERLYLPITLIFCGRILEDDKSLIHYDIKGESTLYMLLELDEKISFKKNKYKSTKMNGLFLDDYSKFSNLKSPKRTRPQTFAEEKEEDEMEDAEVDDIMNDAIGATQVIASNPLEKQLAPPPKKRRFESETDEETSNSSNLLQNHNDQK